jgi:hypothetical protein
VGNSSNPLRVNEVVVVGVKLESYGNRPIPPVNAQRPVLFLPLLNKLVKCCLNGVRRCVFSSAIKRSYNNELFMALIKTQHTRQVSQLMERMG